MDYTESHSDITWKNDREVLPLFYRYIPCTKPDRPLIVYAHGAFSGDKFPYYNGFKLGLELNSCANFLLFSDPLIKLFKTSAKCSWFSSPFEGENITQIMSKIVKDTAKEAGSNKILFIGGSAGAIPLIRLGEHFDGASFFVWNPQLHLFKYHKGAVDRYCKALSIDDELRGKLCLEAYPSNCNMLDKKWFSNSNNKYYILQMFNDDFHLINHTAPFYKAIRGREAIFNRKFSKKILPNVLLHIGRWSYPYRTDKGTYTSHLPPNRLLQKRLIKDFVMNEDEFSKNYFRKWDVKRAC